MANRKYRTQLPELGSEILITIEPRGGTWWHGSRQQLVDAEILPQEMLESKECLHGKSWCAHGFDFWVIRGRRHPMTGQKGGSDFWMVRRLIDDGLDGCKTESFRRLYEARAALDAEVRSQSDAGRAERSLALRADRDETYGQFRAVLLGPARAISRSGT